MSIKLKQVFLRLTSALMLFCALPMVIWSVKLINNAALDFDFAGVGCFGAALLYVFSIVTALIGLRFAGRPHLYEWCRIFAYTQLIAGFMLIFLLLPYAVLTLPPLFILTILYLSFLGWTCKCK